MLVRDHEGANPQPTETGAEASDLIGMIYDAALNHDRWTGALREAVDFIGASSAALYTKNVVTRTGSVQAADHVEDFEFTETYFNRYIRDDPTNIGHCYGQIGKPANTADLMEYDAFLGTSFYKEWVRPQALVDCIGVPLERTSKGTLIFGAFLSEHDGLCSPEARRKVTLLAPHIQRAQQIGKVMEARTAEAASLADTLDGLSTSVMLLDDEGRVIHANAPAQALLANRSVMTIRSGRLSAGEEQADRQLLQCAASAANGDLDKSSAHETLALKARDGQSHVVRVLPLTASARRVAGVKYDATVAVFVQETMIEPQETLDQLARKYGLTRAELRVLATITQGGGVAETADKLGIAVSTVKTHLHRLFAKTGTTRQSDLVRMLSKSTAVLR